MNPKNFFGELQRRNVYKVAVAYAVVGWLLIQIATQVFPFFDIPNWGVRLIVLIIVLGFPIALIVAWAFELTPEGLKRTEAADATGLRPSRHRGWIMIVLIAGVMSLGIFFLGRYTASRAGPAEASGKSIAVLPFENLSEDKANAYFAKGVQDEILTRLAKIADLKVISRTSTQRYQSSPENLTEIARQLGVAHVLEGSVQKSGEKVRVNVQLIKASNDGHVWAETYDRKMSDMLQVESEVAQRIASALAAQLSGRERSDIANAGTTNTAAYDFYLRGLALESAQSPEEGERAISYYRQAVELDPKFAEAWGALANREAFRYFADHRTPEQFARAREAAETGLKLQPDLSEVHIGAGAFYYYCLQDFDRALSEFNRARERAPGNADAIMMIGMVKRRQGKLDESIELLLEAGKFDPRNNDIWVNLGRSHRGARRFAKAREMFDRALAITPGDGRTTSEKIETWLAEGDLAAAERSLGGVPIDLTNPLFNGKITLLTFRREFDRAMETLRLAMQHAPPDVDKTFARLSIAGLQFFSGNVAAARPIIEDVRRELEDRRHKGDESLRLRDTLLQIEAALGDRGAFERDAEELLQTTMRDQWRLPETEDVIAHCYAIVGDADNAIPHIERALAPSQQGLTPAYLRLDPVWDKIRNDPRFQKLANQP